MGAGNWFHITGTSDDGLIADRPTVLRRVVIGTEVASQTIKLYDAAAVADVAAGNLIASIKTDSLGGFELDVVCGRGLVAIVSGGTLDITVVWG
jgi:hypothetical protein